MPPNLNSEQMDELSKLEKAFGHYLISEDQFRVHMIRLGFQDWEVDEYVDDLEADEP